VEKFPVIGVVRRFKNIRQKCRNTTGSTAHDHLPPIKSLRRIIKAFKPLNQSVHDCTDSKAGNQMFFCARHN
jgi:hypothetical protein